MIIYSLFTQTSESKCFRLVYLAHPAGRCGWWRRTCSAPRRCSSPGRMARRSPSPDSTAGVSAEGRRRSRGESVWCHTSSRDNKQNQLRFMWMSQDFIHHPVRNILEAKHNTNPPFYTNGRSVRSEPSSPRRQISSLAPSFDILWYKTSQSGRAGR